MKLKIEKDLGTTVEWKDAKKASRFIVSMSLDVSNRANWEKGFSWLYEMCIKIKEVIKNYGK